MSILPLLLVVALVSIHCGAHVIQRRPPSAAPALFPTPIVRQRDPPVQATWPMLFYPGYAGGYAGYPAYFHPQQAYYAGGNRPIYSESQGPSQTAQGAGINIMPDSVDDPMSLAQAVNNDGHQAEAEVVNAPLRQYAVQTSPTFSGYVTQYPTAAAPATRLTAPSFRQPPPPDWVPNSPSISTITAGHRLPSISTSTTTAGHRFPSTSTSAVHRFPSTSTSTTAGHRFPSTSTTAGHLYPSTSTTAGHLYPSTSTTTGHRLPPISPSTTAGHRIPSIPDGRVHQAWVNNHDQLVHRHQQLVNAHQQAILAHPIPGGWMGTSTDSRRYPTATPVAAQVPATPERIYHEGTATTQDFQDFQQEDSFHAQDGQSFAAAPTQDFAHAQDHVSQSQVSQDSYSQSQVSQDSYSQSQVSQESYSQDSQDGYSQSQDSQDGYSQSQDSQDQDSQDGYFRSQDSQDHYSQDNSQVNEGRSFPSASYPQSQDFNDQDKSGGAQDGEKLVAVPFPHPQAVDIRNKGEKGRRVSKKSTGSVPEETLLTMSNHGAQGQAYVQSQRYIESAQGELTVDGSGTIVHEDYAASKPNYSYEYSVNAPESMDYKIVRETRNGRNTIGAYSFVQPDGCTQIVRYRAGPDGYRAAVEYRGGPDCQRRYNQNPNRG